VIDTAWGLYKAGATGRAALRVTGRDIETTELALAFDERGKCWELRVPDQPLRPVSYEVRVARALRELGGSATTDELAAHTGIAKSNVSRALRRLIASRSVRRLPRDGRRVPYEWVR
jgi:hypothetical protein